MWIFESNSTNWNNAWTITELSQPIYYDLIFCACIFLIFSNFYHNCLLLFHLKWADWRFCCFKINTHVTENVLLQSILYISCLSIEFGPSCITAAIDRVMHSHAACEGLNVESIDYAFSSHCW